MQTEDSYSLLVLPDGSGVEPSVTSAAAAVCGADPYRFGVLLKGRGLTLLARGTASQLDAAARGLTAAGVKCRTVGPEDLRAAPRPLLAGGVAAADGALGLRVHGRLAGPPPGVPLLFVLGDLGEDAAASPGGPSRAGDTFSQRLLRATYPVVDVVWAGGRVRVPLRQMAWRELPGRAFSPPANLGLLLAALAAASGGTILDLEFDGQELLAGPPLGVDEPLEGADRTRTQRFDRYAAAAAAAWSKGLYPAVAAGRVALARDGLALEPGNFFARKPAPAATTSVPWIRRSGRSRVRPAPWAWLAVLPVPGLFVASPRAAASVLIAGFALGGAGLVLSGLAALRRRERLRSLQPARIRSMALGPVQVSGRVAACAPLVAPYSRTRCGWFRFELRERGGDDPEDRSLLRTTEAGGSGDLPFWLVDETGAVLVQPAGAEVDVEPYSATLGPGLEAVEWSLPEGGTIFVSGVAQRRSTDTVDPPAPSGHGAPERDDVFLGSAPGEPLVLSARSRKGESSRWDWQFRVGAVVGGVYLLIAVLLVLLRVSGGFE